MTTIDDRVVFPPAHSALAQAPYRVVSLDRVALRREQQRHRATTGLARDLTADVAWLERQAVVYEKRIKSLLADNRDQVAARRRAELSELVAWIVTIVVLLGLLGWAWVGV